MLAGNPAVCGFYRQLPSCRSIIFTYAPFKELCGSGRPRLDAAGWPVPAGPVGGHLLLAVKFGKASFSGGRP